MTPVVHFGIIGGTPLRLMSQCEAPADELVSFRFTEQVTCARCRAIVEQTERRHRERLKQEKQERITQNREAIADRTRAPQIWVARACGAKWPDVAKHFGLTVGRAQYLEARTQARIERQWRRFEARYLQAHGGP